MESHLDITPIYCVESDVGHVGTSKIQEEEDVEDRQGC